VLAKGNEKLGRRLWSWSLPAVSTCPGATALCKKLCYATRGRYRMMHRPFDANLRKARSKHFVARMSKRISRMRRGRVVRIHVSGDFESAKYVRKWIEVIRANPQVTFYAYTRSWRVTKLKKSLRELAKLPNMRLWLSCDQETGPPPRWSGSRRCYLCKDDQDQPTYPVELVFREKHKTVMKTVAGSAVCPVENGATPNMTCDKCRLCFNLERLKCVANRKRSLLMSS